MNFGDGAAALLVSASDTIAEVKHFDSTYYEIQDTWRSDKDTFVRSAEDRFAMDEGYSRVMRESVVRRSEEVRARAGRHRPRGAQRPQRPPVASALAQKLGFDEKTQVQDVLHAAVGDTGCAMSLMSLVAALERAESGEKILLASYGNGCDVVILETTEQIESLKDRRGIQKHLASKSHAPQLHQVPALARTGARCSRRPARRWSCARPRRRPSGAKCPGRCVSPARSARDCGTPQYPPQRVCVNCHTKDEMEPYSFVDVPAKVFSFSHDYVMESIDSPVTVTFVDFEGGGRIMCDMTDRDPAAIEVGMPLEMTFRRLYYVGGIHNYWWKCQPVRC